MVRTFDVLFGTLNQRDKISDLKEIDADDRLELEQQRAGLCGEVRVVRQVRT
jgi:hypothetical protein